MKIKKAKDPEELAQRAADWMVSAAKQTKGAFAVALSGGETPRDLYRLLATPPYSDAFPFERAHWFFGDERFVRPDDTMSNYRMVREALFDRVPVAPENIHRVKTENVAPEESARLYEQELKRFYGSEELNPKRPLFDIVLLGLGQDGHTASLFPGNPVLRERQAWVAVVNVTHGARITLTYPVLNSARHTAFLVTGFNKRGALRRLIKGDESIPAARIRPIEEASLFADTHAMATD